MISPSVLHSHEIVTEYTFNAETQTQYYTGIDIDKSITAIKRFYCLKKNHFTICQMLRNVDYELSLAY